MTHPALTLTLAALAASCLSPATAKSLPTESQLAFARPQQMVDIGGRRLHLYCSGAGPLTVVFDAHAGGAGASWFAVQPHVAKRTRACVYDRAGLGFSDLAPRANTSGHAVEDLHKLLASASIAPPYLLVGSSYGGANAQLYAYRYPEQVAGMVLVEPQHEDEIARLDKVSGGKLGQLLAMNLAMIKTCHEQSVKGFVAGSEPWTQCVRGVGAPGNALAASEVALRGKQKYWQANLSENTNFEVSGAELRALRKPFGKLPLIVLSRSVSPYAQAGKPQSALNKAVEAENQVILREIASLSSAGKLRRISGAGHVVHDERPMAVVEAINEMLTTIAK